MKRPVTQDYRGVLHKYLILSDRSWKSYSFCIVYERIRQKLEYKVGKSRLYSNRFPILVRSTLKQVIIKSTSLSTLLLNFS